MEIQISHTTLIHLDTMGNLVLLNVALGHGEDFGVSYGMISRFLRIIARN
jgi:hypothetical protein